MSRVHVPEHVQITCDRCKRLCQNEGVQGVGYQLKAFLKMERGAFDFVGDIVASGDWQADLCDACLAEFERIYDQFKKGFEVGSSRLKDSRYLTQSEVTIVESAINNLSDVRLHSNTITSDAAEVRGCVEVFRRVFPAAKEKSDA